jgi:C4-dicarboxylate transporter DctM subunit
MMFWGILILLSCITLGLPIYLGLLAGGLYILVIAYHIPVDIVVINLYDGVAKFTLLAVPYFLFAGALMENSSISRRLVDCSAPWLVRVRGGLPIAGIVANEIFGAISGSAAAATATIGRVMYPAVVKTNGERFSLGLFTSAGALAIIMPPSINMILFATATNISIGALFLTGIVPALILGACLTIYIFLVSPRPDPSQRFDLKLAVRKTIEGLSALSMPVVILGGIYTGVFTPTEAGAVSAVYAFILPVLLYREMGWAEILSSIKDTTKLSAQIFILIASSTVFSQALTVARVPDALVSLMGGLAPFWFLMILNGILLVVGCFFDPTSAVLVLAPVMTPIARALGIDLLHLGIVFTVNLAIGMFTPPFGLNLFVMQSIFKKRLEELAVAVPPFFVVFFIALMIITYFPELYLWLPRVWLGQYGQ